MPGLFAPARAKSLKVLELTEYGLAKKWRCTLTDGVRGMSEAEADTAAEAVRFAAERFTPPAQTIEDLL